MTNARFQIRRTAVSLAAMALSVVGHAQAATITVNSFADDALNTTATCSLRMAVLSVNTGNNVGGCVADIATNAYGTSDAIVLPSGTYNLTITGLDDAVNTGGATPVVTIGADASKGDLDITRSVQITGAGSGTTTIQWDPSVVIADRDRIFHIYTSSTTDTVNVGLKGLTLTGGQTNQSGHGRDGANTGTYTLRRAGGALAIGAASAMVLVLDTPPEGSANSEGRGGSKKPGTTGEASATYGLTLTDVHVLNNAAQGDGGGLYLAAATTATSVVVDGNTSSTNGGGIYNEADTTILNSTISNNQSEGGGGFFGTGSNTVTVSGSTFYRNTAVGGGAISQRSAVTMNIRNTTIANNIGTDVGGGLYTNGKANLVFVTIAFNQAGADASTAGSGINTFPSGNSAVTLKNVLLAKNMKGYVAATVSTPAVAGTVPANCGSTSSTGTTSSLGHNLSDDTTCTSLTQAGDKTTTDAKVAELASNSGATMTIALLDGSPALNAGIADAGVTTDQRGNPRESTPDIGAFEALSLPTVTPTATDTSTETAAADDSGGGGCTMNPGSAFDPSLPALILSALGGAAWRRRRAMKRQSMSA